MKSISDNESNHFSVLINSNELVFDEVNNCTKSPYIKLLDGVITTGINIESIKYNNDMLFIEGWSYGPPLIVANLQEDNYILRRFSREDVSNELGIEPSDEGFLLQINIEVGQKFRLEINDIHIDISLFNSIVNTERLNVLNSCHDDLLIVGGAPSSKLYLDKIIEHKGEIWALNDAVFWLEGNDIKVDKLVVADQRFIDKKQTQIKSLNCKSIISADYLDLSMISDFNNFKIKVLGRDGVSEKVGEAYHGCTVANFSLQIARLLKYKAIYTVGVLLHFPTSYERIDGTKSMPEFVHHNQIKNMKKIIQRIRKDRIDINAFEPNSNVNFL
jgi:hypothetical protein